MSRTFRRDDRVDSGGTGGRVPAASSRYSTTAPASVHGGRPRDPSRDQAIRDAVLELLAEEGYEHVTIEAVAARAGAGKATVYRRWSSKAELVIDAVAGLQGSLAVADTGSLRGDLDSLCVSLCGAGEARKLAVMRALASALPHDHALAKAFSMNFIAPRRALLAAVFERAIARGEIAADRDLELLTAVIPALTMYRLMSGGAPPDQVFVRQIVTEVLLPAATATATAAATATATATTTATAGSARERSR